MLGKHFLKGGISIFFGVLVGVSVFAAENQRPNSWVRAGELGPKPKYVTDEFPLSDQGNQGHWKKYELMSDEFEGTELDSNKWYPKNPRWLGRQPAYFYPGNVSVGKGKLHLKMKKEEVPEMPKDKGYHTYTSAAVQSKTRIKYGYFEVKCRPMKSHGSSSFWFYDNTPDLWTEIDVFEIGGAAPGFEKKYNMNVHVFRTPAEKKHWSMHGEWVAPSNLADDYHVYGLEWNKDKVKWYFDGVLVRWVENTHWHQPLTLNFDSETMPKWFGLPKDSDLPSTYSIEYVRAWKKRDEDTISGSALSAGYVQGDVISYSYVPNKRWTRKESLGILPYLCEYGLQKHQDDTPLEEFHNENIRRIDIAGKWSTAVMLYPRRKSYRDEIVNLMIRCFKNRQLIILRVYWSPGEPNPYAQAVDLLEALWKKRNKVLTSPEGDQATGRQLINNILMIKLGDEGLGAFGTEGLEVIHRTFYDIVKYRSMDGRKPFAHIKAWYNMIGYWDGCYAASQKDIDVYKRRAIPANAEFIGTDVYQWWGLKWSPFDPYGSDITRAQVRKVINNWHNHFTKYYPAGLSMEANREKPSPESQNETHAMIGAIDLTGASDAMMFFIGVSAQIRGVTYTTPVETMDAYFDNLKAGPWIGLCWWHFGDFGDTEGAIHYIDKDLVHYTLEQPKGVAYSRGQLRKFHNDFIASRMRMFEDVVYNQFGHLNKKRKKP
jgi:beta-glucanase (GH16 family)